MSYKRSLIVAAALLSLSIAAGAAYAEQSQSAMPRTLQHRFGLGMMGTSERAGAMMEACNGMMEGTRHAPNGQWRQPDQEPKEKG